MQAWTLNDYLSFTKYVNQSLGTMNATMTKTWVGLCAVSVGTIHTWCECFWSMLRCQRSLTFEGQVPDNFDRERNYKLRTATRWSTCARLHSKLDPRFKEKFPVWTHGPGLALDKTYCVNAPIMYLKVESNFLWRKKKTELQKKISFLKSTNMAPFIGFDWQETVLSIMDTHIYILNSLYMLCLTWPYKLFNLWTINEIGNIL